MISPTFIRYLLVILLCSSSTAFGQGNGKLQLHFIDVGQGDAAILISPKGETVLFDNGVAKYCDMPVSYLKKFGVENIDYHIASHYHDDHIGCTTEVLNAFPLSKAAYDRGSTYPSNIYKKYVKAVSGKRNTATPGTEIILDAESDQPVRIEFVASNGAGIDTTNENDLSVVSVIRFGEFDAVMGGDLSGFNKSNYKDIESVVADDVGRVEVYKVNHHCSRYSTNDNWLKALNPKIGIISASATIGKNHKHPTQQCLNRLHKANVKTYWTETGGGAKPDPEWDKVSGTVIVEVDPDKDVFNVIFKNNRIDTYPIWQ